jgi:hypothetical protein
MAFRLEQYRSKASQGKTGSTKIQDDMQAADQNTAL